MKKMILLAVAAVSIAGQVHAAPGSREAKPDAVKRRMVERTAREAGHQAQVSPRAGQVGRQVETSFNGLLTPSMSKALQLKMSADESLVTRVETSLSLAKNANLTKLAGLRIKGEVIKSAMNANSADPIVQSFRDLVGGASDKAQGWGKEVREVMEGLADNAIARIERSIEFNADGTMKSIDDATIKRAMEEAKADVERDVNSRKGKDDPEFKLALEDISKYCK